MGHKKKNTHHQILGAGGTATLASATITGAASAAGLSVTGSTIPTNGVYLPSANNLGFAYNSTLGMTLNSTGLGVGIAPDSAKSTRLSVYQTGDLTDETAPLSVGNTAAGGMRLYAGVNNTNEYVYLGSVKSGTGYRSMILQPNGGNVGVGITPSAWGSTAKAVQIGSYSAIYNDVDFTVVVNNAFFNGTNNIYRNTAPASQYYQNAGSHVWRIAPSGTAGNAITFTQAMTLDASGNLLVGTTTQPTGVTYSRATFKSTSADWASVVWNSNATPYGLRIQQDTDVNGTGNEFLICYGYTNIRASIRSNGGIANYSANNVSLSDARAKTDIKPLASYWNKIKSLELVTFKYKDQTHSDDNIGLIAQQVESVAPELVDVDGFGETPADGVPLKTIYTTDLYHASIKALQEAMARIEVLEAKLA